MGALKKIVVLISLTLMTIPLAATARAQTLKTIKDRGVLNCGVSQGLYGFSIADDKGNWSGLDVDFCRALAAAIFDDASKVKFVPVTTNERFQALQSGAIDVLSRNSTWTLSRETDYKLNFGGVLYYDGQGFMLRKALNINSALDLDGKKVCVQSGTTTELNLKDFFATNNMKFEEIALPTAAETEKAYDSGRCDVLTSDVSGLYAERVALSNPSDHVVLPDVISKEPLGPAVRQGDDQWFEIVKWTLFAMLNAEELGVSSETLDAARKSTKPDVMRLVGNDGNFGEQLGLTKDWVVRIVGQVGNYADVFTSNVGSNSKLGIPRAENNLWSRGGIQYAPPIR
ncbi:MAG: amino acid ABC transporter substrate-binding protein [Xanthobacteraceae bacterium]|nr:amino acid ABC transporter substrate-binding protein [Xanthobacteraceae bacterium]